MADVIDEKVVSMQFDNKQFEKGVEQSLKSIQELKDSLNFDKSVKNLDSLAQAGKKFDFSGVSNAVEAVTQKFSALEVAGITALANLTNSAVNFAKNMAKSVTIDPVKSGMGIYEQKMNSVMTIMNNSGKSLSEVNDILQELNEYSDKTIFSLNDMTTALGKFTAQGVDAKKAVDIIKGAANEAATMGAGSAEFGRMIYNLTQAYGMGSMKILDWKSFENANVAGKEFKEQIIESAIRLGTLDKEGRTLDKHIKVTTSNFREYLSTGFMTAEVMTDTFEKYAGLNENFKELGEKALGAAQNVKTFHQLMDVLSESVASQWSQAFNYIIGDFNEARRLWTSVNVIFENTLGKINANRTELLRLWHEGFTDPDTGKKVSGRIMLMDGLANVLQTIAQVIKPIKDAFRDMFPAKTAENLWSMTKAFRDFTAKLRIAGPAAQNIKDFFTGIFSVMKLVRTVMGDILKAIFPSLEGFNGIFGLVLRVAGAFGRWLTSITTAIRESEEYQEILKTIGNIFMTLIKIVGVFAKVLFNVGKAAQKTGLLQKALNLISKLLTGLLNAIIKYGPMALTIIGGIVKAVIGLVGLIGAGIGKVGGFFKDLFSKKDGKDTAKAVSEVVSSVTDLTKTNLTDDGENVIRGFGQGLLNGLSALMTIVKNIFGGVITTVESIFRISSPSKVFIAIGGFILSGLLIGLTNPALRAQIGTALTNFANSTIIQGFKTALTKGFNAIANVWSGALTGITSLLHKATDGLQSLGKESDGLAGKIGKVFNSLVSGLKNVNAAALLLTAVIGTALIGVIKLLKIVVNITSFMNEAGGGFRNITKGFVNTTKAFKQMAKAFKRNQNPIVKTLQGIALSIMAVTAALFILSSIEDKNGLWMAAAVLAGSLLAIVAILVAAAQRIKAANLTESVDTLAKMMIMAAASILILTVALSSMAQLMKQEDSSIGVIVAAFTGITVLAAVMFGFVALLSKIPFQSSLKSVALMLAFSVVMNSAVKALRKLSIVADDGESILYAMISLATVLGVIGLVAMAASMIPMSGVLAILSISILMGTIAKVITNVDWGEVAAGIERYYKVVIGLYAALAIAVVLAALCGKGIKNFGEGMRNLALSFLAMAAAFYIMKEMDVELSDIGKMILILGELITLLSLTLLVVNHSKIPQKKMKQLSLLMASLGLVMLEMAAAVAIASHFDADGGAIAGMGIAIAAFLGGITLILTQLGRARGDNDLKDLSKLIKAFTLPILSLAVLAKVYQGSTAGDIAGVIFTLVGIFVGIGVLCTLVGNIKEEQVKFLSKLTALLLVAVGDIILLSMIPTDKLVTAMSAFAVTLMSLYLVTSAMGRVKADSTKPMLAMVASLVVIGASLTVLAKLCNWEEILSAAGAMSAVLLALAVSLAIVSGFGDKAIKGASSLLLASASLIVVGGVMYAFADSFDWKTTLPAIAALGTIALSLAIVSGFGKRAILGAISLVTASAALLVVGIAMQSFMAVDWGAGVGKMAACLGILSAFVAIWGIPGLDVMMITGALGLIMASVGLIAVAKAMQMFSDTTVGGGYLSGIAGALMLVGVAGVILAAGAAGLIAGGLGLIILAAGLRVMSGVDTKVVNGKALTGIAAGLMMLGLAGVVLGLGSVGLLSGGISLMVLAGALALMDNLDYKKLSKKNLTGLGKGLTSIAAAGIVGTLGGPGLLALSIGLTAAAGAMSLYINSVDKFLDRMEEFGDTKSVYIGANVIYGMVKGMQQAYPTLLTATENIFKSMINVICATLGVHSPSEVLRKIGEFTGWGFLEGWANSAFVQKLDQVSAALASDHVVEPFATALSEGFGDIGNIFSGIDFDFGDIFGTNTRDFEAEIASARQTIDNLEKGRMNFYRKNASNKYAQQMYEKRIDDAKTRLLKLEEEYKNFDESGGMFSGLLGGVDSLGDMFDGLKEALAGIGTESNFASTDADALASSLDGVGDATTKTTQKFGENIDMLSEFDRSLNTTVKDIESNMIDRILGTDQWNKYLSNLKAMGYDLDLVKEIADKGMDSGYDLAAALNRAGMNEAEKDRINKMWRQSQANKTAMDDWYKNLEKELETTTEGTRVIEGIVSTRDYQSGEAELLAEGIEADEDVKNRILKSIEEQSFQEEGYDFWRNLQIMLNNQATEAERAKEKAQKAQEAKDKSAADLAMSYMADAITDAINKYMPPTEFAVIGQNVCLGFASGILSNAYWPVETVKKFAQSVIDAFCQVTKVESPSKVFKQIGEYCTEGLALGLEDSTDAEKNTKSLGKNMIDLMEEQLAKIQKLIESDEEWRPVIKPVVDFTDIQAGADATRLMFNSMPIEAAARDFNNLKIATSSPENTIAGMSRDEFTRLLNNFAVELVAGIEAADRNINTTVVLKGNAKGLFDQVVEENNVYKRANGSSAFV